MSQYKTIAESNNFIVLEQFIKYYEVNEVPAVYQTEAALELEFIQDLKKNGNTNGLLRAKPRNDGEWLVSNDVKVTLMDCFGKKSRNDVKAKLLTFPSLRAACEAIQTGTTAIATPSLRAAGEAIQKNNPTR